MAGRTGRHRMVQQPGLVRRLLPAPLRRPDGCDHRLRLRLRFHQGPAAGRNLLRPALSTRPRAPERGIGGLGALRGRQGLRGRGQPPKVARSVRGAGHLPAQTRRTQEALVQATAALGGEHPPDRGNRLREAPPRLRPSRGAAPRDERVTGTVGGQGGAAQLLYLAQRATLPPSASLRGLASMVILIHTKRLREFSSMLAPPTRKRSTVEKTSPKVPGRLVPVASSSRVCLPSERPLFEK